MLNRRKQLQDNDDPASEDRVALLGGADQSLANSPSNSSNNVYLPTYPTQPRTHSIPFSNQSETQLLVQRKQREKSPVQTQFRYPSNYGNHGSSIVNNNNLSSPTLHGYQGDSYELGPRGNSQARAINISSNGLYRQQPSSPDFVFYTVQPGDTLQNLSVRYSCPVASIKKLNNLWTDQEFYGLTKIKLPVGKLRLIADVIADERNTKDAFSGLDSTQKQHTPESTLQTGTSSRLLEPHDGPTTSNQHLGKQASRLYDNYDAYRDPLTSEQGPLEARRDSVFKDLDFNIEQARKAAQSYDENASAIMQTLALGGNLVDDEDDCVVSDPNKIARREAEILLNDMSDYGLSYSGLILFIFIVCLICPLAYVIYLEETHHEYNKAHPHQ